MWGEKRMERKKEKLLNLSQRNKEDEFEKDKSHSILKIPLYLAMFLLSCAVLLGIKTPVFASTGVNVTTHTKDEIRKYYKSLNIEIYRTDGYKKSLPQRFRTLQECYPMIR